MAKVIFLKREDFHMELANVSKGQNTIIFIIETTNILNCIKFMIFCEFFIYNFYIYHNYA